MQDRTLQRSYVKQAASRKKKLNLREYPTPNRVNNINNNNNNNNNMRTPQPRRYVHFEEDGTQYHYPRSNNNKNSSSSYRHFLTLSPIRPSFSPHPLLVSLTPGIFS